ncbi:SCO3242 family prenyltransferase [Streptomyces sp. NPDC127084]|uniref:SCO3242 family prenyltransferase n=1 Tax=Streptomyces sp. NPDC127084 TaxID=3347133 RepID=UPI00365EE7C2
MPTDDQGDARAQPGPRHAEGLAAIGAWVELLRLPAVFTVPGDVLAGTAAAAGRPNSRTVLAVGCSLCLYEAAMALNGWVDRVEDAAERPNRPLPSGRIRPNDALTASCVLTAAGLALGWHAGGPAFTLATALAATVWAYNLLLKDGLLGPVATATARSLDLLLGAATVGQIRPAVAPAVLLGTHTLAVSTLSRQETRGGSALPASAALGTVAMVSGLLVSRPVSPPRPAAGREPGSGRFTGTAAVRRLIGSPHGAVRAAFAACYAATAALPYAQAAVNPSSAVVQRAVGRGIHATIPLQAALAARSGALATGALVAALAPLATKYMRKVSVT